MGGGSLYIPLGWVGRSNSVLYGENRLLPGIHPLTSSAADVIHALTVTHWRNVTEHRAQTGRKPWVRDIAQLPDLKGVNVGRSVCARTSALPEKERMNDRIANGSSPMYGP